VGPDLPQKLLPAEVSGYCFFRFRDKGLFQGGVVNPTPNPGFNMNLLNMIYRFKYNRTRYTILRGQILAFLVFQYLRHRKAFQITAEDQIKSIFYFMVRYLFSHEVFYKTLFQFHLKSVIEPILTNTKVSRQVLMKTRGLQTSRHAGQFRATDRGSENSNIEILYIYTNYQLLQRSSL
jgi:hypothetical protein